MIKRNKLMIIITSIIILTPIIVGLILWNSMPQQIPSHWNAAGEVDGYSSKPVAVFGFPALLLGIHLLGTFATAADPKNKGVSGKPVILVLWLCPMLSIILNSLMYLAAMGYNLSVEVIMPLFMGAMFVVIGNYLPKCKQNYTIGIKIPWTLDNEENWNKTHRLAGIVWVIGGVIIMLSSVLRSFVVFMVVTLAMVLIPVIFSYVYHLKHPKD